MVISHLPASASSQAHLPARCRKGMWEGYLIFNFDFNDLIILIYYKFRFFEN